MKADHSPWSSVSNPPPSIPWCGTRDGSRPWNGRVGRRLAVGRRGTMKCKCAVWGGTGMVRLASRLALGSARTCWKPNNPEWVFGPLVAGNSPRFAPRRCGSNVCLSRSRIPPSRSSGRARHRSQRRPQSLDPANRRFAESLCGFHRRPPPGKGKQVGGRQPAIVQCRGNQDGRDAATNLTVQVLHVPHSPAGDQSQIGKLPS